VSGGFPRHLQALVYHPGVSMSPLHPRSNRSRSASSMEQCLWNYDHYDHLMRRSLSRSFSSSLSRISLYTLFLQFTHCTIQHIRTSAQEHRIINLHYFSRTFALAFPVSLILGLWLSLFGVKNCPSWFVCVVWFSIQTSLPLYRFLITRMPDS